MKRVNRELLVDGSFYNKFKSPIPPHLSPEEYLIWKKQIEWENKEHARRKAEGYYPNEN